LAVRVKLLVSRRGEQERRLKLVALVNSGFEADTAQLLLPLKAAELLGFHPPSQALEQTYATAGGPAKVWVYPGSLEVKVSAGRSESRRVKADLVVSPIEDEALISDKLAGRLEIVVEDFGRGVWRLRGERRSHATARPQLWRPTDRQAAGG